MPEGCPSHFIWIIIILSFTRTSLKYFEDSQPGTLNYIPEEFIRGDVFYRRTPHQRWYQNHVWSVESRLLELHTIGRRSQVRADASVKTNVWVLAHENERLYLHRPRSYKLKSSKYKRDIRNITTSRAQSRQSLRWNNNWGIREYMRNSKASNQCNITGFCF